jgi:hypothetical protein
MFLSIRGGNWIVAISSALAREAEVIDCVCLGQLTSSFREHARKRLKSRIDKFNVLGTP